jgi:hypothetical protein
MRTLDEIATRLREIRGELDRLRLGVPESIDPRKAGSIEAHLNTAYDSVSAAASEMLERAVDRAEGTGGHAAGGRRCNLTSRPSSGATCPARAAQTATTTIRRWITPPFRIDSGDRSIVVTVDYDADGTPGEGWTDLSRAVRVEVVRAS